MECNFYWWDLVLCNSWRISSGDLFGFWVSRLVPLVARDGHITQISRPALVKAEYIIISVTNYYCMEGGMARGNRENFRNGNLVKSYDA